MNGGVISGNKTAGQDDENMSGGGGVNITDGSKFNMSGGEISNNSAFGGGGVYSSGLVSTFNLGGKAVIRNNTDINGLSNNVGLYHRYAGHNTYITLGTGGNVPASGMEIWVSTITTDSVIVNAGAIPIHATYFRADEPSKTVVHENGRLAIRESSVPNSELQLGSASSWSKEGITTAVDKGLVPIDLQGDYTNIITRAEFCRMATKWLEYRLGKNIDAILVQQGKTRDPNTFTDTQDPDILAAFALGITSGTGGGLFTPNGQFTREQAATMIRNVCSAADMNIGNVVAAGFEDISDASNWAVDSINFVRNNGIMTGTSTTPLMFSPKATYTREQSIITFNNIK